MEVSRAEVGPGAVGSSAGHRRDPADVPVLLPPLMPHPNALLQALEMLWICHCACFSCAHLASDNTLGCYRECSGERAPRWTHARP